VKLAGRIGGRRPPAAPDAALIRTLAGLLTETGLTEIEYAVGDTRIRVARDTHRGAASPPTNGVSAPPFATPNTEPAKNGSNGTTGSNGTLHLGTVKSPIVGIAYLAPQPGMAPFVRVGDTVSEGQALLIIEAMKVMNQIRSPRSGRIARIFIEDADPVEYDAPLMLIE
jgi:acetyl-CoA carboxylase biotin carboxyl carrier protein